MDYRSFQYSDTLAYTDALAISVRLQRVLDDVAPAEVHLFAYLACLLSLYNRWPAAGWGYSFATTSNGYPYSAQVDQALRSLSKAGAISEDSNFFVVTPRGKEELELLVTLRQFVRRLPFIDGACASTVALPVGVVRNAMLEEPDLKQAVTLRRSQKLLEELGVAKLHEHFEVLRQVVGPTEGATAVPAIVWLNYLAEMQRLHNSETQQS